MILIYLDSNSNFILHTFSIYCYSRSNQYSSNLISYTTMLFWLLFLHCSIIVLGNLQITCDLDATSIRNNLLIKLCEYALCKMKLFYEGLHIVNVFITIHAINKAWVVGTSSSFFLSDSLTAWCRILLWLFKISITNFTYTT